ncbi:hypothetical protein PISMIDRAFT_16268 [Pisolithus microcarpus 441]|uniref:Unplaced genomic scaffold scaffold_193, whole genome shotgun sequence n=1 Tax=Pisolithus microcarpus 441 TaxID=765257 RepID=A0A0C9YPP7_9AGAM|nr:hypothetical protein PISMIDRAFT_16268 [Pisolithus microcarpus 441]
MFGDGPRSCIGKTFALAEIKMVLSMAIRHFVLAMKDGPDSKVELSRGIILTPKVVASTNIPCNTISQAVSPPKPGPSRGFRAEPGLGNTRSSFFDLAWNLETYYDVPRPAKSFRPP